MAEVSVIQAVARPRAGKGAARAVRRDGLVPGVIYGDNRASTPISIDGTELWKTVQRGRFLARIFDIEIDGQKHRVIPRDIQLDPIKDHPLHVDFQRVTPQSRVRVVVPTKFVNEAASPGLKRGGMLNIVRHDVEVLCPPDSIPSVFEFDLAGMEIGRSIHISAIELPQGVQPTITGRDFTVATIAGKGGKSEEAAQPTEGAEEAKPKA